MTPLACQRALFDMPADVAYLNAATCGPVPLVVRDAGLRGVVAKATPWATWDWEATAAMADRVRAAAGALIGAASSDMAIIGSVSHGLATAGRALPVAVGHRVLRVAGEQSSNCLEWARLAEAQGGVLDIVPTPGDGDWTRAVIERIGLAGAPPVDIAALTPCHWTDGSLIDLERIAPVLCCGRMARRWWWTRHRRPARCRSTLACCGRISWRSQHINGCSGLTIWRSCTQRLAGRGASLWSATGSTA